MDQKQKVTIIYGSVGGNTHLVVERVSTELGKNNIETVLVKSLSADASNIEGSNLVIFASPTYYHGLLEDHFAVFISKLKLENISGLDFAIIGLGDKKYDSEYITESAQILEDFVNDNGGNIVMNSLRINGYPLAKEKLITRWAQKLAKKINQE